MAIRIVFRQARVSCLQQKRPCSDWAWGSCSSSLDCKKCARHSFAAFLSSLLCWIANLWSLMLKSKLLADIKNHRLQRLHCKLVKFSFMAVWGNGKHHWAPLSYRCPLLCTWWSAVTHQWVDWRSISTSPAVSSKQCTIRSRFVSMICNRP